jgi:hypothetical protein
LAGRPALSGGGARRDHRTGGTRHAEAEGRRQKAELECIVTLPIPALTGGAGRTLNDGEQAARLDFGPTLPAQVPKG